MSVVIYNRYCRPVGEQLEFDLPSLTEQHHKSDCDVNEILRRYMKTGILDSKSDKTPLFGDFSGAPRDYAAAVQLLDDARARFASLPSPIRERFGNDPFQLLQFLDDPHNREEAVSLGLLASSAPNRESEGQVAPEAAKNENNGEAVTPAGGAGA